ncbi:MAG: hypothetical protein A3F67_01705 [Verrucomicrobia bacterium RIFCSPHIGHO2_12_FULL_41_10]|nr:MAG: hypothetical protein A3F67_01705 [Verrucomicrobia bacterium RIFCSPHIGHO2_12_FULL_41_10]
MERLLFIRLSNKNLTSVLKSLRNRLTFQLVTILVVTACMGCHGKNKKADLIFVNGVEPETLDPTLVIGQPDTRIVNELFEGLLRFNRAGVLEAGMASSWDVSPDKLTYIFHLRSEARWSDGRPITAQDFVASWKRSLLPATGSAYNYQLFIVRGAEDFSSGKEPDFSKVGIQALDDRTLKVVLQQPTAYFLQLCAFTSLYPVPVNLIDRVGDAWIKPEHIIGNGAYVLSQWRINDKIVLKKNPYYWDAAHVALETVEALPISKANVAYNFYAAGQADLLIDKELAPPSLLEELKNKKDFHVSPYLGTYFFRFNCSKPPFKDPRVRKAFALVIDRKRITEKITRAGELCAESFVPPGIPGYQPPEGLGYHLEEARRLLAEAGYPGGRGFPLTTYLYNEGELNEGIAVELQAMWNKELGVSILLARQEWKAYLASLNSLDFGMVRSSWIGDYLDPNTFLDQFVTDGGNNRTGWSSKRYDQLIKEASLEIDPTKRFEILRDAEKLLVHDDAPIIPLYFYLGIQIYDPNRLGGIEGNLLDKHPISQIYKRCLDK